MTFYSPKHFDLAPDASSVFICAMENNNNSQAQAFENPSVHINNPYFPAIPSPTSPGPEVPSACSSDIHLPGVRPGNAFAQIKAKELEDLAAGKNAGKFAYPFSLLLVP